MGRTRTGKKYNPQDRFFHEAKKQGFVARSALKLEEIDQQQKLFKKGMKVLDLGCAPGSWLQYAAQKVGPSGKLWGIDLEEVRVNLPQVKTATGDLLALQADDPRMAEYLPFDMIQSDAMVKTSGVADADCARSIELVEHGVNLAMAGVLKPGGIFLAKVFEGPGFTEFYVDFKRKFRDCRVNHPKAVRSGSREVYVLGYRRE